jgi:hypothetical protein
MQRAGHAGFETTRGYIREAENLRASFGKVFPQLPENLFESSGESSGGPVETSIYLKSLNSLRGADGNRTSRKKLAEGWKTDRIVDRQPCTIAPARASSDQFEQSRGISWGGIRGGNRAHHESAGDCRR